MQSLRQKKLKWQLMIYDLFVLFAVDALLLFAYKGNPNLTPSGAAVQTAISFCCIFGARVFLKIYAQIWRYGGIQCYIKLLIADGIAFVFMFVIEGILPIQHIAVSTLLAIACMNLLASMAIRMFYRYAYKFGNTEAPIGKVLRALLRIFAGKRILMEINNKTKKVKIAIVGAGRVGVILAEDLLNNQFSAYNPVCFLDTNYGKTGREIHGVPVLHEDEASIKRLEDYGVSEVVITIPGASPEKRKELYNSYTKAGYKVKLYDFPFMQKAGGKRQLRDFDIEELLFRKSIIIPDDAVKTYYKDKVILVTGGGGSIGSEMCRQLAKMNPKQIIILDIYENGAYDIQQELRIVYGADLDLKVEIASITDRRALERIFRDYRPQIVINAAAHKHVPLMEKNCVEAVENNVFGTLTLVDICEEFGAERFMLVSTDKAVNPTNVMGATKRMCEMIVSSRSLTGNVKYSMTRFGNVLGSAGSVVPLFKRQIANGGPITITDKRIIRYFMTIPEASQLVLESGAMAKNGELFVLDMGEPVKILDLAENMIRLSGIEGIEIVETGLRPGEKLYEEILVDTETLEKTENALIFIEKDEPLTKQEIEEKLDILKKACDSGDDEVVREALKKVVSTYRTPEDVNAEVKLYNSPKVEVVAK